MGKLGCACGYVFRLSDSPCRDEYWAINDERMIESLKLLDKTPEFTGGDMFDFIFVQDRILLLCPLCTRIYFQDLADQEVFHPYISEELLYEHKIKYDF